MRNHRILKYDVVIGRRSFRLDAREFKPLCVQMQDDKPFLWAVVETPDFTEESRVVVVVITVIATGKNFDASTAGQYVGTFQQEGFVGHVFCEVVK